MKATPGGRFVMLQCQLKSPPWHKVDIIASVKVLPWLKIETTTSVI